MSNVSGEKWIGAVRAINTMNMPWYRYFAAKREKEQLRDSPVVVCNPQHQALQEEFTIIRALFAYDYLRRLLRVPYNVSLL
jgi:hypothetical protein